MGEIKCVARMFLKKRRAKLGNVKYLIRKLSNTEVVKILNLSRNTKNGFQKQNLIVRKKHFILVNM